MLRAYAIYTVGSDKELSVGKLIAHGLEQYLNVHPREAAVAFISNNDPADESETYHVYVYFPTTNADAVQQLRDIIFDEVDEKATEQNENCTLGIDISDNNNLPKSLERLVITFSTQTKFTNTIIQEIAQTALAKIANKAY